MSQTLKWCIQMPCWTSQSMLHLFCMNACLFSVIENIQPKILRTWACSVLEWNPKFACGYIIGVLSSHIGARDAILQGVETNPSGTCELYKEPLPTTSNCCPITDQMICQALVLYSNFVTKGKTAFSPMWSRSKKIAHTERYIYHALVYLHVMWGGILWHCSNISNQVSCVIKSTWSFWYRIFPSSNQIQRDLRLPKAKGINPQPIFMAWTGRFSFFNSSAYSLYYNLANFPKLDVLLNTSGLVRYGSCFHVNRSTSPLASVSNRNRCQSLYMKPHSILVQVSSSRSTGQ